MSFVLFQAALFLYVLASAAYLVFFFRQKTALRSKGRALFIAAFGLHSANILARFLEAGHTPITTLHESVSFFSWSLALCYLSFCWRYRVKNLGAFVSIPVVLLMLAAAFSSRAIQPLPPLMQSAWLPFHASASLLAYGFFALATLGSVMYLLQEREIKQKRFGLFYSRLPSLEALDTLNNHCLSVGFIVFTLGMISGVLWAKQAFGGYWRWDPKETWSLIAWLLYAALIHQRFTVGWRGKPVALLTILIFAVVLFTFWGASFLFEGYHGAIS